MAQRLKDEVRQRIVEAALEAFSARGYRATRLADLAAAAGVSTGNVYRYFPDKEALLAAAVPREVAARLLGLLRARVHALSATGDWTGADAAGSREAEALLAFWTARRREVIVLLGRAEGSPLEHVRPLVAAALTRTATRYQRAHAEGPVPRETRFVVRRIFEGTIEMIVGILAAHERPEAIRAAFAAFWRFQLAGLQALLGGEARRADRG